MKIIPISYDSFSVRSMATLVITDTKIFIDPSVAIGPNRYGLEPHKIELEELEKKREEIYEIGKDIENIFITHYHWDHCPNPKYKHFEILYNKNIYLKDIENNINNSQRIRGRKVVKKLNGNSNIIFSDGKEFEIENTYVKFSEPLHHGDYESKLGFVLAVYIQYNRYSMIFASDIQGIQTEEAKRFIIENDPLILILSGPPYYIKWDDKKEEMFIRNLADIVENTGIREVIMDHHSARSKEYGEYIKRYNDIFGIFGIRFISAAEYIGISNRLLEANRDILYQNDINR